MVFCSLLALKNRLLLEFLSVLEDDVRVLAAEFLFRPLPLLF